MDTSTFSSGQTHYGNSMNMAALNNWAEMVAADIRQLMEDNPKITPVLLYTGMSGISAATAIMMHLGRHHNCSVGMVYVRKPDEKSHGARIEYANLQKLERKQTKPFFIVVDDFIHSGETVLNILRAASMKFRCRIAPAQIHYAMTYDDYGNILSWDEVMPKHKQMRASIMHNMVTSYNKFWKSLRAKIKRQDEAREKADKEFLESLIAR